MIGLRPLQDRIIVKQLAEEEKVGSILLPDTGKEKPFRGTVLAVGRGTYREGQLIVPDVRVGETVIFGKYSGTEIEYKLEKYLILREDEIFVAVEDTTSNILEASSESNS